MLKPLLFAICLNFGVNSLMADVIKKEFELAKLEKIDILNNSGKVTVLANDGTKVLIEVDKIQFESDKGCVFNSEIKNKDKKLRIEAKKEKGRKYKNTGSCEANIKITIPSRLATLVKNGAGSVEISGVKSDTEVDQGAGSVDIKDAVASKVGVKLGTGSVNLEGKFDNIAVKSGVGSITIKSQSVPAKGSYNLSTGTGSAVVYLPEKADVKFSQKTGFGSKLKDGGFTSNAGSQFQIEFKSGMGSLELKKL